MSKDIILDINRMITSAIVVAACLAIWFLISKVYFIRLKKMLNSKRSSKEMQNSNAQHLMYSVVRGVIIFVAVMSVMSIYGIDISATVTGLGLASVVVGLALQDIIRDIFKGFALMSDKFYTVGDVVEYDGKCLEVMAFTFRSTKFRDIDTGDIVTMFNGNFDEVTKLSGVQFLDIPLPYDCDYNYINKVMADIVTKIEAIDGIILSSYKGLQDFGESALIYRVKITTRQADRPEMRRAALRVIQEGLAEADIHIPFNQLDVHLDKLDL